MDHMIPNSLDDIYGPGADDAEMWQDGVELIADERQRQIEVEEWTAENDDSHRHGEMAMAAASYLIYVVHPDDKLSSDIWPWDMVFFKPKDAVANLVRAGALIAAEIDRLQRVAEAAMED